MKSGDVGMSESSAEPNIPRGTNCRPRESRTYLVADFNVPAKAFMIGAVFLWKEKLDP